MSSKKPPSSSDENLDESELSRKLKSCVRGVERRLTPSSVVDLGDFQVPVLFADHHVGDSWDTSHNISHMDVVDVPDAKPVETPVHPEPILPVETVQILPAIEIDPHPTDLVAHFDSGVFTVGETGKVSVDFLYDGGGYKGQLAIFSLKGMESFDPDSTAFIHEAATRALSNSNLGHILIDDLSQAAHFASADNGGQYLGEQSFAMQSGDRFGMMLVPNGTVQTVFDTPDADGEIRPLFSMATANPNDAYHVGQIADVFGDGKTFVFEDLRFDKGSDGDYNDLVFHLKGATGKAVTFDQLIADGSLSPSHDWRGSDLGHQIESYVNPPVLTPDPIAFPVANQPLIGIIDTGFAANNPDIDYSRITLGHDYIGHDANPLLSAGEGSQHGTHILGIIGATQDNGVGIDGVNDNAPIWLGRAVGSGEWANSLTEFVNHSVASGHDNAVVNLSMDLTQVDANGIVTPRYEFTPPEREALELARQKGVLIVVAAGNDGGIMSVLGQSSQEFDNIITVGAAEGLGRADYSNYGYGLDILADGGTIADPILSTVGDGVGTMAGTSVATGQVTGAIAQIWAANPDLSYRQVIDIVKGSAIDLNTLGWDMQTGAGLLNLAGAIGLATATKGEVYNPLSFSIPTTWGGEGKVTPEERAVGDTIIQQWIRKLETSSAELSYDVASDKFGNIYVTGYTNGSLKGTSAGNSDAWIAKYDSAGQQLWIQQSGTAGIDRAYAVAVDNQGNAYIAGDSTNNGSDGSWVTKYDVNGNQQWQIRPVVNGDSVASGVTVDALGNTYVTGYNYRSGDAWVTKFDSNRVQQWQKTIATPQNDTAWDVAVDSGGNVYVTGRTFGSLDGSNAGSGDIWVSKYSNSGDQLWVKQFGTSVNEGASGVTVDSSGNVFIAGAGQNAWVAKYDGSGSQLWKESLANFSSARDVAVDTLGNVYLTGSSAGSLFVAKYSNNGILQWTQPFSSTNRPDAAPAFEDAYGITINSQGNIIITGSTGGNFGGTNQGGQDAWIAKYSQAQTTPSQPTSFTFSNGKTLTNEMLVEYNRNVNLGINLGQPDYVDNPSQLVKSYFGTDVQRAFFNNSRYTIYKSQYGAFTAGGAIEAYYSGNYFETPNTNNGLFGVYSGLGVPISSMISQSDGSQIMYFEGGSLTNRNGIVTPNYSQKNGDRFDLVGQGAPFGQELQWKNDYSWFNPASVGQPIGSVRRINQGWIQEFTNSPRGDGDSIFLLKDNQQVLGGFEKYTNNFSQTIDRPAGGPYRVQGGTLAAYYSVGGYARQSGGLGFPTMSAGRSDYLGYKSYLAFENGFIAETYDGRTIIQGWSGQVIQPEDPRRLEAAQIIKQTYQNEKGLGSPVGSLIGDVQAFGNNGWIQYLTGDSSQPYASRGAIIYQNGSAQGVAVYDDTLDFYDQYGVSTLGYPMSRPIPAITASTTSSNIWYHPLTSGYAVEFVAGSPTSTLLSPRSDGFIGTFGAWAGNTGNGAPILQREAMINKHREKSILAIGPAIANVESVPGAYMQRFRNPNSGDESAFFAPNGSNKAYFVLGEIWKAYQSEGGALGGLGFPRSDEIGQLGGVYTQFDNGRIEWSENTRKIRIIYNNGQTKEFSVDSFQDPVGQNEWTATFYRWNSAQGGEPPTNFYENQSNRIGVISLGSNQRNNGDSGIDANWGGGSPNGDSRIPVDNFAVRAYTNAYLEAGKTYRAWIRADDGYQLFAKNQVTGEFIYFTPQNQWQAAYGSHVPKDFTVPSSGMYDLHFHLYEGGGDAYMDLAWGELINGFIVSGKVLDAYRQRPDLGLPTSGLQDKGGGFFSQTFEHGRVDWNGVTANPYVDGTSSQPVTPTPTKTGRANSLLNFRVAPNASASTEVLAKLSIGSEFKIISSVNGGSYSFGNGSRNDWYEIEYNGKRGYVAAAYVDTVGSSVSNPPPSTPNPVTTPPLQSNPTTQNPLTGFQHPLLGAGSVTQGPGGSTSHTGRAQYAIDYGVKIGTPVYAMRSGKVIAVRDSYPDTGGGVDKSNQFNYVLIEHDNGYRSAYLHLKQGFNNQVGLAAGDTVNTGQLIGYSGNSGWSTGPHLHVEVHKPTASGNFGQTVPFVIDSKSGTTVDSAPNSFKIAREAAISRRGIAVKPSGNVFYATSNAGSGWVQQFTDPDGQKSLLMLQDGKETAYWVIKENYQKYMEMGGSSNNRLGFPLGDRGFINSNSWGGQGTWQAFSGSNGNARIYYTRSGDGTLNGAVATWGAIGSLYEAMGGSTSWLGVPTKQEWQDADGITIWVEFERGLIAYNRQTGKSEALQKGQQPSWNINTNPELRRIDDFLAQFRLQFASKQEEPWTDFQKDLLSVTSDVASDLLNYIDLWKDLSDLVVIGSKKTPEFNTLLIEILTQVFDHLSNGDTLFSAIKTVKTNIINDPSMTAANKDAELYSTLFKVADLIFGLFGLDSWGDTFKYAGKAWDIATDPDSAGKALKELGFEIGRRVSEPWGRSLGAILLGPTFPANVVGGALGHMVLGIAGSLSLGYGLASAKEKWGTDGQKILNGIFTNIHEVWKSVETHLKPTVDSIIYKVVQGWSDPASLANELMSVLQGAIKSMYEQIVKLINKFLKNLYTFGDALVGVITFRPIPVYAEENQIWPSSWNTSW